MDYRRIIPCLDTKGGGLVKGVNFVDLKEIGDPAEAAAAYSAAGADELILLDITATAEKRRATLDVLRRVAAVITVPLTAGGGVRSCKDIEDLLAAGADRVSIGTAAILNPTLVLEAAEEFGPECITVAIDARPSAKMPSGFEVMVHGGHKATGRDAVEWADQVEDLGAGCIVATRMDADGTLGGYDIGFTRAIADAVSAAVVASGGAGKLEHLYDAIVEGRADAVLVASIAHFKKFTIRQMKQYLAGHGVPVRLQRHAPPRYAAPSQQ